jgi:general secretion pathway protein M
MSGQKGRMHALRARWQAMAPREQALSAAAAALVALALVWWIALGPALRTLSTAQQERAALDAQLQRMLQLREQAKAMQSQPRRGHDEAVAALQAAMQQLGANARHAVAADRATVTLTGVSSEALARWFTQVRVNAHALPAEARLTRNPAGLWEGTLVLALPPR